MAEVGVSDFLDFDLVLVGVSGVLGSAGPATTSADGFVFFSCFSEVSW